MTKQTAIHARLTAPPSKSLTQRAVAAALLSQGESRIVAPSYSDDARVAVAMAKKWGATVLEREQAWHIIPAAAPTTTALALHCRESALCARLFAPLATVFYPSVKITGSGTLRKRPMDGLADALAAFGVDASLRHGRLPLQTTGLLSPGTAVLDASGSSQTLSGMLMALPLLNGNSELTVRRLVSRPYAAMTIEVMQAFGIRIVHENEDRFFIPGGQRYTPQTYSIEGDWSSAAYWLVVGAIGGSVTIDGLHADSRQADKAIIEALRLAGAELQWDGAALIVRRRALKAFRFDATDCPDLFPPLAVLAAFCDGRSVLEGADRLLHKESNRVEALRETLGRLGVSVTPGRNCLTVEGKVQRGGRLSSFHDHRIAMAAACAGLFAPTPVYVGNMRCIRKSYPAFTRDLALVAGKKKNDSRTFLFNPVS
ncbi:MAG: 3-phosphoshikimate 1-carboxyvinyltransferase [Prevotellaceae bacterium]|jgi:3-phosphoshikimate 1-carboxyvinyltransferase|nr:3-phosphoshikimate 1-carboxyvinyltransferase [Prevotellaceae bacterium]